MMMSYLVSSCDPFLLTFQSFRQDEKREDAIAAFLLQLLVLEGF